MLCGLSNGRNYRVVFNVDGENDFYEKLCDAKITVAIKHRDKNPEYHVWDAVCKHWNRVWVAGLGDGLYNKFYQKSQFGLLFRGVLDSVMEETKK